MKEKKRRGSTNLSDRDPLTESRKQFSYQHPNRIRSKRKQEVQMNPGFTFYFDSRGVCCYRLKEEVKLKKGDVVQVWNDKEKEMVCLGWGEVIGIGVGCKEGIPLIDVGSQLVWGKDYFCIPEKKALEITMRIEKDLEKALLRNRN